MNSDRDFDEIDNDTARPGFVPCRYHDKNIELTGECVDCDGSRWIKTGENHE